MAAAEADGEMPRHRRVESASSHHPNTIAPTNMPAASAMQTARNQFTSVSIPEADSARIAWYSGMEITTADLF